MKPTTLLLLAAALVGRSAGQVRYPRQPLFGSGPPLVNRKVHASYINSSAGPIRVIQVVNVNLMPVRGSPSQGRDVETVEEHENAIPAYGSDRRTQVDVFVDEPGRRPPPQRLTDYAPFLDSNQLPAAADAGPGEFVLPLAAYSAADAELHDDYLDQIVDFVLEIVCRTIHTEGKDAVPLPDVHREFTRKLGPLQLKGSFDATGGTARNLSTLRRTQAVSVRRVGDTLEVSAGLGLGTLAAAFSHYEARLGSLHAAGDLVATVASDSVVVSVNISLGQQHCVQLHQLQIDQLGHIDVKITGLGELSWLTSKVVSWLTDVSRSEVVAAVQKQLSTSVSAVLARVQCNLQQFLALSLRP